MSDERPDYDHVCDKLGPIIGGAKKSRDTFVRDVPFFEQQSVLSSQLRLCPSRRRPTLISQSS